MQDLIQAIRELDADEIVLGVNHPKMQFITSYDVYEELPSYLKEKVDRVTELCEEHLTTYGRINIHGWAAIRAAGYRVEQGPEDMAVLITSMTKIAFDCY